MKRPLLISIILMIAGIAFAQNLIPNPSFEDFTTCPASWGQIKRCTGWYANTSGTPDYFNPCHDALPSSPHNVGVPDNGFGTQPSANGGYSGLITVSSTTADYREYMGANIAPLIPGAAYRVTLTLSLADIYNHATDAPSIFFFEGMDTFLAAIQTNLEYIPQVTFPGSGHISNKLLWTTVADSFIADSAYTHLAIGNFKNNASTTFTTLTGGGPIASSYYYIDSISLERIPVFVSVNDITHRHSLTIFPNPSSGSFAITLPGTADAQIVVTDLTGRVVKELSASGKTDVKLDAPAGVYIVTAYLDSGVLRQKIVVR